MNRRSLLLVALLLFGLVGCSSTTEPQPNVSSAPPTAAPAGSAAASASVQDLPQQILDQLRSLGSKPVMGLPHLAMQGFLRVDATTGITKQGCVAYYLADDNSWVADAALDWCLVPIAGADGRFIGYAALSFDHIKGVDDPKVRAADETKPASYFFRWIDDRTADGVHVVYDLAAGRGYRKSVHVMAFDGGAVSPEIDDIFYELDRVRKIGQFSTFIEKR